MISIKWKSYLTVCVEVFDVIAFIPQNDVHPVNIQHDQWIIL